MFSGTRPPGFNPSHATAQCVGLGGLPTSVPQFKVGELSSQQATVRIKEMNICGWCLLHISGQCGEGYQEASSNPTLLPLLLTLCTEGTPPGVESTCHHSQMFAKQEA